MSKILSQIQQYFVYSAETFRGGLSICVYFIWSYMIILSGVLVGLCFKYAVVFLRLSKFSSSSTKSSTRFPEVLTSLFRVEPFKSNI